MVKLDRFLTCFGEHELEQDTMVVVVSEQGSAFPFGKWTCYDTGLQSACIVRWPGTVKPSSVTTAMVEYVDVLPTFMDAAGISRPDSLDGKSFVPVLLGETNRHKEHVFGIMTTRGIINASDTFGIRSVRGRSVQVRTEPLAGGEIHERLYEVGSVSFLERQSLTPAMRTPRTK